ncbi:hypothetical protein LCGC14_2274180, partial [marine sediment metagenome]
MVQAATGGRVAGIPFVLSRAKREVNRGGRRTTVSVLEINYEGSWADMIARFGVGALPAGAQALIAAPVDDERPADYGDPEPDAESAPAAEAAPPASTAEPPAAPAPKPEAKMTPEWTTAYNIFLPLLREVLRGDPWFVPNKDEPTFEATIKEKREKFWDYWLRVPEIGAMHEAGGFIEFTPGTIDAGALEAAVDTLHRWKKGEDVRAKPFDAVEQPA